MRTLISEDFEKVVGAMDGLVKIKKKDRGSNGGNQLFSRNFLIPKISCCDKITLFIHFLLAIYVFFSYMFFFPVKGCFFFLLWSSFTFPFLPLPYGYSVLYVVQIIKPTDPHLWFWAIEIKFTWLYLQLASIMCIDMTRFWCSCGIQHGWKHAIE